MPSFNSRGEWCSGVAGAGVYWQGGRIWTEAGGARWFTPDDVIGQRFNKVNGREWARVEAFNVRSGVNYVLFDKPAIGVEGSSAGHAAILVPGFGVVDTMGREFPGSGLGSMGPDGSYCLKRHYQGIGEWDVIEPDGARWRLTSFEAYQLRNYGGRRVTWVDPSYSPQAAGFPVPRPLTMPFWWFQYLLIDGDLWQLYQAGDGRTLLHPRDSPIGYVVATDNAFGLDGFLVQNYVWVVRASEASEHFGEVRLVPINLGAPRADVRVTPPPVPVPVPVPPTPEPPPMAEPESIVSFLHAERAKYPEIITGGTGARIIGDAAIAAAKAGFPGWGYSVKPSGNNVELPDGVKVAYDVMMNRLYTPPNDLYDVFQGQEEGEPFRGIVTWAKAHPHNASDRPWHAPIGAGPVEPGEPGTPPAPGTPGLVEVAILELVEPELAAVRATCDALQRKLEALETKVDGLPAGGGTVTLPEIVGIQSVSKGAFLRHDHGPDNLAKFDRTTLGSGEQFRLVVPE